MYFGASISPLILHAASHSQFSRVVVSRFSFGNLKASLEELIPKFAVNVRYMNSG